MELAGLRQSVSGSECGSGEARPRQCCQGGEGPTISSQDCAMPRLADPSTPTLPPSPPIGILGEAPVLHHGDGLHGGLDPHLHQPHQPGRAPAACQGRGGQHKQEQARWAAPLRQLEGLGRWAAPCLGPFSLLQEAARSPESQALPKRPPLPKSEEVKVVPTSSGSPLLSSPPPAHPGPDPREGFPQV